MTWVNTDGDFYPGADRAWAAGAGGTRVLWNRNNGIVFAAFGADNGPSHNGIPHVIERSLVQKQSPPASSVKPASRDESRRPFPVTFCVSRHTGFTSDDPLSGHAYTRE
jgi:hypothetical protein